MVEVGRAACQPGEVQEKCQSWPLRTGALRNLNLAPVNYRTAHLDYEQGGDGVHQASRGSKDAREGALSNVVPSYGPEEFHVARPSSRDENRASNISLRLVRQNLFLSNFLIRAELHTSNTVELEAGPSIRHP